MNSRIRSVPPRPQVRARNPEYRGTAAAAAGVKSALRVLDILEHLAVTPEPLGLLAIARHFGFPKSSTLALMGTLVDRGYVERDAQDRYRLRGPLRLRWAADTEGRLLLAAHAPMAWLHASTRETVSLGVLTPGCEVRVLTKLTSPQEVRYDSDASQPRPAYCTAMGRVLLGHRPAAELQAYLARAPFPRLTPATLTSGRALAQRIREAREHDLAVVLEEFSLGGSGAAVPLRDGQGRVVAALNVATVTSRFEAQQEAIVAALREAASQVTRSLGNASGEAPTPPGPARAARPAPGTSP